MKKISITISTIFLVGCGKQLPTKEEMIPLINKKE
jgi:PBP1b-binding outer membrane lipoprotein LpoB